ncbi:hypothetical protein [Pseudonocardia phyllosphaerae]|uniref:hypothetical protein n=1 Tax=Pseudonocardia phyllosphaerae TaxID=3390502 RepID=UPI00397E38F0
MNRSWQAVLAALLSVLVVAGCGSSGSSSSSSGSSGSSSSSQGANVSDDGDAPPDPEEKGADAAPINEQCPTENTKSFAKTKFVLHSGLAFGAFHRWIYKPYKAGTFQKGAKGRVTAFIKGGLAALFIKREIRLASEDVKANPTLCKTISAPLAKVGNKAKDSLTKLKSGDTSEVEDLNSSIGAVKGGSAKQGAEIKEDENADITSVPK